MKRRDFSYSLTAMAACGLGLASRAARAQGGFVEGQHFVRLAGVQLQAIIKKYIGSALLRLQALMPAWCSWQRARLVLRRSQVRPLPDPSGT